jgi:diguanylate cyclase (GGDEF)-like protein
MDLHTLHVEHTVALGLYTILTFVNSWLHRGTKGVDRFPIYNLCAFAGALLIALRGHIPDPVSIVVGDLFFPIAYLFLNLSLTEFFGEGSGHGLTGWKVQAALIGVVSVGLVQYGMQHPDTKNRLIIYSAVLSMQLALIAYYVFRRASGTLLVSGGLMGVVVALISLSNVVRLVGVILHGAPANYLHSGPFLAWTVLNNSVLQGGVTVAFVWMTAAVLRHDLHVQATTDSLTGLLNRRAMEMTAEQQIAICRRRHQPISAILIDLDDFKRINDSHGHHSGDAVLIAVAQCLQQHLRGRDLLARLGGDEFVALLPETRADHGEEVAERLRAAVEELRVVHEDAQIGVRASFGLAHSDRSLFTWDQLLMHCDKALYAVKDNGGNGIRQANDDLVTAQ